MTLPGLFRQNQVSAPSSRQVKKNLQKMESSTWFTAISWKKCTMWYIRFKAPTESFKCTRMNFLHTEANRISSVKEDWLMLWVSFLWHETSMELRPAQHSSMWAWMISFTFNRALSLSMISREISARNCTVEFTWGLDCPNDLWPPSPCPPPWGVSFC